MDQSKIIFTKKQIPSDSLNYSDDIGLIINRLATVYKVRSLKIGLRYA